MRHSSNRHRLFPPGEEQHPLEAAYAEHTRALGDQGLRRQLPRPREAGLIDFSHNDYLGLSRHPRVLRAAQLALQEDGVGATGSRLLSGNSARVEALEARIAADKDCEAALVFGTALALRGGTLAWPWGLIVLGTVGWVLHDASGPIATAFGMAPSELKPLSEAFRWWGCVAYLSAGLLQRQARLELSRPAPQVAVG